MKLKKQKIGWWISTMLFDIGIILLAQSGWESRGYWLHPLLFGLFLMKVANLEQIMFWLFLAGNALYYIVGIALAFAFKDNRAFCKYLCPITVFLKPMSYFSLLRVHCDEDKCVHCGKCLRVCPMNVEVNKESRKRKNGTECILCYECTKACPKKALH